MQLTFRILAQIWLNQTGQILRFSDKIGKLERNGLTFSMRLNSDHRRKWLNFCHGLWICLCLAQYWFNGIRQMLCLWECFAVSFVLMDIICHDIPFFNRIYIYIARMFVWWDNFEAVQSRMSAGAHAPPIAKSFVAISLTHLGLVSHIYVVKKQ